MEQAQIRHISSVEMYEVIAGDKTFSVRKWNSHQDGDEEWTVTLGGAKIEPGAELYHAMVRKVQEHLLRR